MKASQIIPRLLDAALLVGLVFGSADVKVFAFWMVSIMVALLLVGVFAMPQDLAEKMCDRSPVNNAISWLVCVLYVAALIYGGFPILAALYAFTALGIRAAAKAKLTPQVTS